MENSKEEALTTNLPLKNSEEEVLTMNLPLENSEEEVLTMNLPLKNSEEETLTTDLPPENSNEETLPAATPYENRQMLAEVHAMEDRIDITSMEIEDLEDACAGIAGEISSLRAGLDKITTFPEAKDAKLKVDHKDVLPESISEEKQETADETAEKPAEQEGTSEEKPEEKTGILRKKKPLGVLDYQPELGEAEGSSIWEATSGENVLDPFAPDEGEDKRQPKPEKQKGRKKKEKKKKEQLKDDGTETQESVIPAAEESAETEKAGEAEKSDTANTEAENNGTDNTAANGSDTEKAEAEKTAEDIASSGEEQESPKEEKKKRRIQLPFRKKKTDPGKVYCPSCGTFVGEETVCPSCGAKVR